MGKTLLWIVIIIVIVTGAYLLFWNNASAPSAPATNNTANGTSATVMFTDNSFSPSSITVKKGQAVTWVNQGTEAMWVASASHPAHTVYGGTSRDEHCATGYAGATPFDECAGAQPGGTYTFAFDKAGTWKYHNHLGTGETGTVIVTE